MADRGPLSNRDMPRQNNAHGNNGYGNPGYGNNGYGNSGYGNNGYGNAAYGNTNYGNTGYGNTSYSNTGYGNSAHGNNGHGNHGYNNSGRGNGGYDNFDRRGSVDVRKPQQQNAYRMRNNRNNTWQRGPVAPSNTWRDQGRPAEMGSRNSYHNPDLVQADAAGRRPYSAGTRPKTPELVQSQLRSNSRDRGAAPAHALAAYSDVAAETATRPKTPELGSEWRSNSKGRNVTPVRALAAYSDVGVETEGNFAASIVGTCQDMCPVREREQRQRLRDLAIFERINGNVARTSATLAVKKFCRTISVAELQPSDVRPQPVLWGTLQYLMHMLDRRDYPFESVHSFLFDRTRAVRQELGMQCIANSQAITMFEEIVRFHIMSERELREKKSGTGNEADSQLNFQQLSKSLLTLLNLYGAVDAEGGSGWLHEAEFYGYYVLLNLGDREQFKAEPLSLWFRRVRSSVLQAPDFMYARKVLRCYRNDNYKGFFDLAQKATYLQGCLMELYFGQMRSLSLKAINCGSYKMHPYPVADIASLILMKQGDTEELCKAHGLVTGIDKEQHLSLMAKQAPFTPSTQIFRHQCTLISRKRAPTFFQEIVGERDDIER
ncbi:hypothetical protein M758_8G155300 [Ceratodon purpureus]|nr:hypothetical protein M758_8G155300 [Ceratodon purpureus]